MRIFGRQAIERVISAGFMRSDTIEIVRAGWNEYFMGIAHQAATRSTCPRKHVGAVIVRDRTVLSTGYNGSIRRLPHCDEVRCVMEAGPRLATLHPEANSM